MEGIITAGILFAVAAVVFVLSIRSFLEKGFLLNNAYLYASKTERETMNKKPYYRQTAVIFFLIGIVFMLNGFAVLWDKKQLLYLVGIVMAIMLVYAIVSAIKIEKQKKQK